MSYEDKRYNAWRNVRQNKGFMCPNCDSFVPAGDDTCYNCGEMPELYSGHGGGSINDSGDNGLLEIWLWFWVVIIAPIIYVVVDYINIALILGLIPAIIFFSMSSRRLYVIFKKRFLDMRKKPHNYHKGLYQTSLFNILVRAWVFYFSGRTLLIFFEAMDWL